MDIPVNYCDWEGGSQKKTKNINWISIASDKYVNFYNKAVSILQRWPKLKTQMWIEVWKWNIKLNNLKLFRGLLRVQKNLFNSTQKFNEKINLWRAEQIKYLKFNQIPKKADLNPLQLASLYQFTLWKIKFRKPKN